MAKLSLDWTTPYRVLAVGLCSSADTPDGSPLGGKLLLCLGLPSDMPGPDARRRVLVQRFKPCANPHNGGDMPKYLSAGLTQQVLNNFSKSPPPDHVTQTDVSTPLQRHKMEKITGTPVGSEPRWSHRGDIRDVLGGTLATVQGTGNRPSPLSPRKLAYGAGTSNQHHQTIRLYHRMRIGAAQRKLSRNKGESLLAPGHGCVPHADWLRQYNTTMLPDGANVWYKSDDALWWLGKLSATTMTEGVYLGRFLDDAGQTKLPLSTARYTSSAGAVRGS